MNDAQERPAALPLILQNGEKFYRLSVLAKLLPEKPEYSTVWDWVSRGRTQRETGTVIKMESIVDTSGVCSSVEAYWRFIGRLNGGGE